MPNFRPGIMLLAALFLLLGCDRNPDAKKDLLTIDSVVFTRTGIFLKLNEPVTIRQASIFKEGEKLVSSEPNTKGDALIDLQWQPNTRYGLEVVTDQATVLMPVYAPEKPSPVKVAEIALETLEKGEMEYLYYAWRGAQVRFSPDGSHIGVGSKGGYVYLISIASKKIAWKHKIPEGRVAKVAFTTDGKLLAGEESRDGNVYCFDVKTGNLLWTYKSAQDFNMADSKVAMRGMFPNYPLVCWGLCVDQENNAYAMVRQNVSREANGRKRAINTSMVVRLDTATGEPVWKYPVNNSGWGLVLSRDGRYLFTEIGFAKKAVLSVLDTTSGQPLWQYTFSSPDVVPPPRFGTGFNGAISPDGRYVAIKQVYPNNTYLFDNIKSAESGTAHLVWEKQFLKTLDIGGIPMKTQCINMALTNTELIFSTYSSRTAGRNASPSAIPALHPDADILFVYDFAGKLKWKWKIGDGTWNSENIISKSGKYLALPLGLVPDSPFADPEGMGVYVFELTRKGGSSAKLNWFHHTKGFAYKGDISPDGRTIAVLEGPFDIDPDQMKENIVGEHRLIILL